MCFGKKCLGGWGRGAGLSPCRPKKTDRIDTVIFLKKQQRLGVGCGAGLARHVIP